MTRCAVAAVLAGVRVEGAREARIVRLLALADYNAAGGGRVLGLLQAVGCWGGGAACVP
jgi:hypothetical protein